MIGRDLILSPRLVDQSQAFGADLLFRIVGLDLPSDIFGFIESTGIDELVHVRADFVEIGLLFGHQRGQRVRNSGDVRASVAPLNIVLPSAL